MEGDEINSKQASKRDRTLKTGFVLIDSQFDLMSSLLENYVITKIMMKCDLFDSS